MLDSKSREFRACEETVVYRAEGGVQPLAISFV